MSPTPWKKKTSQPSKKPKVVVGSQRNSPFQNIRAIHVVVLVVLFAATGGILVYRSSASSEPQGCAKGTRSIGYETGYKDGKPKKIRLCRIDGFKSSGSEDGGTVRVSSDASARWLGLFNAAKKDGITLTAASSFRSNLKQIGLRKQNCANWITTPVDSCNPPTAKAGYSNHQTGTAIDIEIVKGAPDPTLTECKRNPDKYPVYKWLSTHASNYGRHAKVDKECWHWSDTGD